MLDTLIHLKKLIQRGGVMGVCCLLIACGGITARPTIQATAQDVKFAIDSIEIRPFEGDRGAQIAEFVKNNITKEGYIKVVTSNGQTVLSGTVSVGKIDKKSYSESYKTKDKNGREVIKYTHYHRKQLTAQATYSVNNETGEVIAGNNFTDHYDHTWSSGENAAKASGQAASDDQIIASTLNGLARQITTAISPHQEYLSFPLPCTGLLSIALCWNRPSSLKLGSDYYEQGHYEEAGKHWQNAIQEASDDQYKAMAYYNLGVLKVHDKKYAEAFDFFKKADKLIRGDRLYMQALTQAEKAGWHELELDKMGIKK